MKTICKKCIAENNVNASYCHKCGAKLENEYNSNNSSHIKKLLIFFFTLVTYIIILNFTRYARHYYTLLISDSLFALIVVGFLFTKNKSVLKLLKIRSLKALVIVEILSLSVVLALIVYFVVTYFNQNVLNLTEKIYYDFYKDSPAPMLFTLLSTALFPSLFEEIAFRGIVFNELYTLTRLKPAIIISSILFASLHFSPVSWIWIFPFALVLGYLRARYRNILYGMIMHFSFNASIVFIQLLLR
ncbi:MAG: CPBP family glutamic-type intramembrane protease [Bacteroidota bacterium]|nr:CPBP family glutamic-type intramembrane protease [Bacteroidota bacterium]